MVKAFRLVAMVEATTFVALLAAVVSYRAFDGPDLTGSLGPVHGVAFVAYAVLVVQIRELVGWSLLRTVAIILAAIVPAGGYLVAHRLADATPEPSSR